MKAIRKIRTSHIRKIAFWSIATAISLFLLFQMQFYLHLPAGNTWNQVANTIKKEWRQGDALHFSPSWLSGYAMSRRRYLNLIRPDQLISSSQIKSQVKNPVKNINRVWVVEVWGDHDGPRTPQGFREKALFQFGKVWVARIEKSPTP